MDGWKDGRITRYSEYRVNLTTRPAPLSGFFLSDLSGFPLPVFGKTDPGYNAWVNMLEYTARMFII